MIKNSKRQLACNSDMNNNELTHTKKSKRLYKIGQIKELHMLNFMCHKNFSIQFHPTHMQIVTGANGSGKSTIANAICLCLGAQARTTGRTSNVQSFIRKGEM
jgi:predicted ATPase